MRGNQQAYDRGNTIFSPDGRLYQVEYAREAVKRGTTSVGVRTADGVVLAVEKHLRSPLLEPGSVEKLHRADDHVGIASAGHVADARQLIDFARRRAQVERLRYGEPIGVETLTKEVTDHVQEYTQTGGARPFGASLLVGGVDGDAPRLFETDPSGTPVEWKAVAIGRGQGPVREHLEAGYDESLSLSEGTELALSGLAAEAEADLAPDAVGVATVDVESGRYRELGETERRDAIERAS